MAGVRVVPQHLRDTIEQQIACGSLRIAPSRIAAYCSGKYWLSSVSGMRAAARARATVAQARVDLRRQSSSSGCGRSS